jgi:hypothetical protein
MRYSSTLVQCKTIARIRTTNIMLAEGNTFAAGNGNHGALTAYRIPTTIREPTYIISLLSTHATGNTACEHASD